MEHEAITAAVLNGTWIAICFVLIYRFIKLFRDHGVPILPRSRAETFNPFFQWKYTSRGFWRDVFLLIIAAFALFALFLVLSWLMLR